MLMLLSKSKIWWFHIVVLWNMAKNAQKVMQHSYFSYFYQNDTPINKWTLYISTWVRHSIKWITPSHLQEHKWQVTVPGSTSQELPVTSRVTQGSLLGPILFLLFVDDVPKPVKTSRVACYADDTKIFKSIDSITDCNALQSDLNDLVSWSKFSVLIFSQSKCKYQCITRK